MSYSYSLPNWSRDRFSNGDESSPSFGGFTPVGPAPDRAIDSALRSVPLPDGLMTRLGMLVYTMPDEAADHVDYMGC